MFELFSELARFWPVVSALVLVIAWAVRAEARSRANSVAAAEARLAALDARERADEIRADLAAFREQAARDYVTTAMLMKIKDEIAIEIRRLGDRFDRWFDRHVERGGG